MDPQSLFSKKKSTALQGEKQPGKLLIACPDELDDQPLIYGLKEDKNVILKKGDSKQRLKWIAEGAVDIGFISSADFSLLKGGWKIIPGMCISSLSSNSSVLFFKKGLAKFSKIAIPAGSSTTPLVLKILMNELYHSNTEIVQDTGNVSTLLSKYDSVLITGERAIIEAVENRSFLNISEEWFQLTGLPLVSGFWIANEITCSAKDCEKIIDSFKSGMKNVESIYKKLQTPVAPGVLTDHFKKSLNYLFGENERDSLEELYRYAFFYGFTNFIPEFNFVELK